MIIYHISDTHGFHNQIPRHNFDQGIDVLVHSGDASNHYSAALNEKEVRNFIEWYSKLPIKTKIFVAGNHDTSIERGLITQKDFVDAGIIYLQNDSVTIDGVKFYGTPYTPTFGNWAFMRARHKMQAVWDAVPDDIDVLITHGPPKGIRDLSYSRSGDLEMCGCQSLYNRCVGSPFRAVLFGHLHNHRIIKNQGITSDLPGLDTIFSNASCVEDGKWSEGLVSFGNIISL